MFKRRTPKLTDVETLIGEGTTVEGGLMVSAGVHVAGRVHGEIRAAKDGDTWLVVATGASVAGNVTVTRVVVHGTIEGDIRATGKVEFGATARVIGDVHYGLIEMAAGAVIQGRLVASGQPAKEAAEAVAPTMA